MAVSEVWELFAKAQHLHFESGDVLVLTTNRRLAHEDIDLIREEVGKISEGIKIMVVDPELVVSKA